MKRKKTLARKGTRPLTTTTNQQKEINKVEIDGGQGISTVVFLVDGKHVVSGGSERTIRRWKVDDGTEVGTPMDAGGAICDIAVSRGGKWIVSGTEDGLATVWDTRHDEKVTDFRAHNDPIRVVDISTDGMRIATGSYDSTACVWSRLGERLVGPLRHDCFVAAVKFSPDGSLIATATWWHGSVRMYDSQNGSLLFDVQIEVGSPFNQSLAWANDGKRLFALARDGGIINCLDVPTWERSQWPIHSGIRPRCIALADNGAVIAVSANSSVSFWDTATHKQVGAVIQHTTDVLSMAVSANCGIVVGTSSKIALYTIYDVLPPSYCRVMSHEQEIQRLRAGLEEITEEFRAQNKNLNGEIAGLQRKVDQLTLSQHACDSVIQFLQCETLYDQGRILDTANSLLKIENTITRAMAADSFLEDRLARLKYKCVSKLEDMASRSANDEEAISLYSVMLILAPSTSSSVLTKSVSAKVVCGSAAQALVDAAKLKLPTSDIYRKICDALERNSCVIDAIWYFRRMQSEPEDTSRTHDERAQWEIDFQCRCAKRLEKLGDDEVESRNYNKAAEHFSTVLSLNPADRVDILIKRSKARASVNSWQEALHDADEIIELDASSHQGYECRHAALHGMGWHDNAFGAFETMHSKLEQSRNSHICKICRQHVDSTILKQLEQTTRDMPRVLIDTTTGHLCDKAHQVATFEKRPVYDELRSSMATRLDHARIEREVNEFYKYAMFSHRWERGEPLFQGVENISVYDLELSSPNTKLQEFCRLVRSLGLRWAWSDTCCIDRKDHVVLQESLVAMFTWYHGASLTIVHLRGVFSQFQKRGDLRKSIWNTRVWTYQEYVAAKTIQFYTEDWQPYLGLTLTNHKESPDVILEMQHVAGPSVPELAALRPGRDRVREKLCLASTRETTHVEDIAYSLLGIFEASIPVIYGEGKRAVGRLLEHVLTSSSDVTILAWTGCAGDYNSCLPTDLTVYSEVIPPHVPQPIEQAKMDNIVMALRSSLPDLSVPEALHRRLSDLPLPWLAFGRLRLPGIAFRLTELVQASGSHPVAGLHVYRATTSAFGNIEIKTTDNLTDMRDLCLIHPWIHPLLDQEFSDGATSLDGTTQGLRLVARLRQPFGAILLAPLSRVEYKRVATDSLIIVHVREETPLTELIDNIRTIEIQ